MAKGYDLPPFRTGAEQTIANRADDFFAFNAKEDGVIVEKDETHVTIQYKSGLKDSVLLGTKHGVVSGTTVPHEFISDLEVGKKCKKGDVVAYDSGFFTRDVINPNIVSLKTSLLAKTVFWESADTTEDSSVVTEELGNKLATNISYTKKIMVDFETAVYNLVKLGTKVEHDSILCTLVDSISADVMKSDPDAIKALQQIASSNPKAKTHGTVSKIEVIYHGEIEEMHPTLQEIVKGDNKRRAATAKLLNDGSPAIGQVDESIHFDTQKLTKGNIGITIYIDSDLGITSGDKLVFGNMLKTTISRVEVNPIVTEDGQKVDAIFGYQSVSDRIVLSPEISGTMNTVLKKLSKEMVNIYEKG